MFQVNTTRTLPVYLQKNKYFFIVFIKNTIIFDKKYYYEF